MTEYPWRVPDRAYPNRALCYVSNIRGHGTSPKKAIFVYLPLLWQTTMDRIRLYIYILTVGLLGGVVHSDALYASTLWEMTAQSSKSRTSTARKKTQRTKTKKRKTTQRTRTSTRRTPQRTTSTPSRTALQAERDRLHLADSLKAVLGEATYVTGRELLPLTDPEPLLLRFRHGDTTLQRRQIEALYFGHTSKAEEFQFLSQVESHIDELIKTSQYAEALQEAQRGLWRNPLHLGILKRACDLAQHEQRTKELDLYIWQLIEILHLIQYSGSGRSVEDAIQVMSMSDAILYETLWLETPLAQIQSRRILQHQGRNVLELTIATGEGREPTKRYYTIRQ